jgi:HTH-type transcriptional regulator/antitoxin HipB
VSKTLRSPRHVALVTLIIEERKKAGLTQWDLARMLGRSQSIIAAMESGQRRIDVVEFLELAEMIGFDSSASLRRIKQTRDFAGGRPSSSGTQVRQALTKTRP